MQKKHSNSTKTTDPLENDQRTKWFREAKYGMFLHLGTFFSVEFNQVPELLPRPNMAEFIQSRL